MSQDYKTAATWYRSAAETSPRRSHGIVGVGRKPIEGAPGGGNGAPADWDRLYEGPPKAASNKPRAAPNSGPPDELDQLVAADKAKAAGDAMDELDQWFAVDKAGTLQPVTGPFEEAKAAFQSGEYDAAVRILLPLAENGNARAQIIIGNSYWRGFFGNNEHRDDGEAIRWWRKAADLGNPEAQSDLGAMYFDGAGVPQDFSQAAVWYLKAANQGYRVAQDRIGAMYEKGQSVGQDYVQAHMWFNLAAANENGPTVRGVWIADRDEVAKKMTPAQIAEAQRMAREWVPKAGAQPVH